MLKYWCMGLSCVSLDTKLPFVLKCVTVWVGVFACLCKSTFSSSFLSMLMVKMDADMIVHYQYVHHKGMVRVCMWSSVYKHLPSLYLHGFFWGIEFIQCEITLSWYCPVVQILCAFVFQLLVYGAPTKTFGRLWLMQYGKGSQKQYTFLTRF